jgi:hypothetical protein
MKSFTKVVVVVLTLALFAFFLPGCDLIFTDEEETSETPDLIKVRVTVTGRFIIDWNNSPAIPAKGLAVNVKLESASWSSDEKKVKNVKYEVIRYTDSNGTCSGTATFYIVSGQWIAVTLSPQGGTVINGQTFEFNEYYEKRTYEAFKMEIPENAEDYTCIWKPVLTSKGGLRPNPTQTTVK